MSEHPDWRQLYQSFRVPILGWVGLVSLVWLLAATFTFYMFTNWDERAQFGNSFGMINALFSAFAFVGVVIALLLQNNALRQQLEEVAKEHDWNRRKSAHDLIVETSLGRFGEIRRQLESGIDIYDEKKTCADVQLSDAQKVQLDAALNFLENICLSIKNNVVDEDIMFDAVAEILVGYHRWARPYITHWRKVSDDFWSEIDPFEERWRVRMAEAKRRARDARANPGRPRL